MDSAATITALPVFTGSRKTPDVATAAQVAEMVRLNGAFSRVGSATLVGGTVTVANTSVTASSLIFIGPKTLGGTVGNRSYTLSAGVGFTINSSSATDTSIVNYLIIEPLV